MLFYRIKQFILYINAKPTEYDLKYIVSKLNDNELILFKNLSMHEQKHCINVAKDVEKICYNKKINSSYLIKIALLHDIGKIKGNLNIIDKSILVILDYLSKGKIRKFNSVKKINIYYNHGKIGADILKKYGYNKRFLYLIENHHNIIDDEELDIIKFCDNKN
ncbi:HDIG domain-containing metalloprotein [Clostridium pasteurianum]|uniref:Putative domain HDIG-containing protein n=1 Tax=Clostridium pasteurianum BC1 TaxID=86416 RepID=R4K3M0_CLOPA|nr:HDIG domain-containing metalloprotein [Clostridium pasteurianum]AGK95124.1 putative domain HDIG-containing protein [Clostridium pasteurianum BC1]